MRAEANTFRAMSMSVMRTRLTATILLIAQSLAFAIGHLWPFECLGASPSGPAPRLVVQDGHALNISSLSQSRDGTLLLTSSLDGTVRLWRINSGRLIRTIRVADSPVYAAALSPDGRRIAAGGKKGEVTVWSAETGKEIWSRAPPRRRTVVLTLQYSPDGRYLAGGGGYEGWATIWSARDGQPIRTIIRPNPKTPFSFVNAVAFSPSGNLLLTAGGDFTRDFLEMRSANTSLEIWSTTTGSRVDGYVGISKGGYNKASFSDDGRYVIAGGRDGKVTIVYLSSGYALTYAKPHTEPINGVTFLAGAESFVTSDVDGKVIAWSRWKTNKSHPSVRQVRLPLDAVWRLSASPDGKSILIAGLKGVKHKVLRLASGTYRLRGTIEAATAPLMSVAVSASGEGVALATPESASLWNLRSGRPISQFSVRSETRISGGAVELSLPFFSPDGSLLLVTNSQEAVVRSASTGELIRKLTDSKEIVSGHFSKTGRLFIAEEGELGNRKKRWLSVWDMQSGQRVRRYDGPIGAKSIMAISPDGKQAAFGGFSAAGAVFGITVRKKNEPPPAVRLHVWNLDEGAPRILGDDQSPGDELGGGVSAIAYSPSGRLLAEGERRGTVRVWSTRSERAIAEWQVASDAIWSIQFSPDETRLLVGTRNGVKAIDSRTGQLLKEFGGVYGRYSADGNYLLTFRSTSLRSPLDRPATLHVWSTADNREVLTIPGALSEGVAAESALLVVATDDRTVRVYDLEAKKLVLQFAETEDGDWLAVAPDGRFDSSNLDEIKSMHWVMSDEPLRPLPIELFMRDYYEPQLVEKIFTHQTLTPVRSLAHLNRLQPMVRITSVRQVKAQGIANVTVQVENVIRRGRGAPGVDSSEVHDLRLFRNGQLVARWPSPTFTEVVGAHSLTGTEQLTEWRARTSIHVDRTTRRVSHTFKVALPQSDGRPDVEFVAYAFNRDRVRSATDRMVVKKARDLNHSAVQRAYVVVIGVSDNQDITWRLDFAAADALRMRDTLADALRRSNTFATVREMALVSTSAANQLGKEHPHSSGAQILPTKQNIETVFRMLAGLRAGSNTPRDVQMAFGDDFHGLGPDDLLFVAFSAHGVRSPDGSFLLLPYDLGKGSGGKLVPQVVQRAISSKELTNWLEQIDASRMYLVLDTCNAGAAVEVPGFKPGPMGDSGLGQLSYDKRMPILAATQPTNRAWALGSSLVTYALTSEGIQQQAANPSGQLTMVGLLQYVEKRVPHLYRETIEDGGASSVQQPRLYVFPRPGRTAQTAILGAPK